MTGRRRSATLLLVVGVVGGAAPALGDERVVQIGRDGVQPQVLRVEPGDTVRFVNEDPTFAYRAQSTGGPWRFDSGPTALLEGEFVLPSALTRPGTYTYRVAQDAPFRGSVVVAGAVPPTTAPPTAAPPTAAPSTTAPPTAAPPTAAPVPVPSAGASTPSTPAAVAAPAVPGPLPGPRNSRPLGLAVTAAVVLLVGVASLLLRLLLALPVRSDRPARL